MPVRPALQSVAPVIKALGAWQRASGCLAMMVWPSQTRPCLVRIYRPSACWGCCAMQALSASGLTQLECVVYACGIEVLLHWLSACSRVAEVGARLCMAILDLLDDLPHSLNSTTHNELLKCVPGHLMAHALNYGHKSSWGLLQLFPKRWLSQSHQDYRHACSARAPSSSRTCNPCIQKSVLVHVTEQPFVLERNRAHVPFCRSSVVRLTKWESAEVRGTAEAVLAKWTGAPWQEPESAGKKASRCARCCSAQNPDPERAAAVPASEHGPSWTVLTQQRVLYL